MPQPLIEVQSDCIRFLNGQSYDVQVQGNIIRGKKSLHNRIDNIFVRLLFDTSGNTIPRDQWESICKEFDGAGSRIGKYLIVREGVAFPPGHETEARRHHFIALSFRSFLTRFAKLEPLREQVRKKLLERKETAAKAKTHRAPEVFVDPHITVAPDGRLHPATQYLTNYWLATGAHGLLVLLAPPGHGKSTLSTEITMRLLNTSSVPILIPFADYRRLVTFEGLIYEFFVKHKQDALSPDALSVVLKYNLATVILDGFDELCETAGITTARENLNAVCQGIGAAGKVLLTSRTAFFRSVMPKGSTTPEGLTWEEAHLEPFDRDQRNAYIAQRTDISQSGRTKLLALLENIPTADQLASSPLVLSELCDMADDISGPAAFDKGIAQIYEWLLERHCVREKERQAYEVSPEMQREILSEIAEWCLLELSAEAGSQKAKAEYVEQIIKEQLEIRRTFEPDVIRKTIPKLFGHALLNTTNTNNPAERYIKFLHHTWHDYLIARRICEFGREGSGVRVAEMIRYYRVLPEYVARFIADMLDEAGAKRLLSLPELRSRDIFSQAIRIAQEFSRKQSGSDGLERQVFLSLLGISSFSGRDIWQAQFLYLPLEGVGFADAVIADTTFRKCDLRGADFTGATLRRVAFDNCDLEKAVFDRVKELSPQDKSRVGDAGAIVDGKDFAESHRQRLSEDLVRQVLAKFRNRSSYLTETVWRRGFSPTNQRRVREVIIPALKRHGFLELVLIAGSRETVQCVGSKIGIWTSWIQDSASCPPTQLLPVIEEVKKRIKFD